MNARVFAWAALGAGCALGLGACTFRDRIEGCQSASDCGEQQQCYKGFCVRAPALSSGVGATPTADGGDNALSEDPSAQPGDPQSPAADGGGAPLEPASGAAGSSSGGGSGDGSSSGGSSGDGSSSGGSSGDGSSSGSGSGDGSGSSSGSAGSCTDGAQQACVVDGASASAGRGCSRGMQVCRAGAWERCVGDPSPQAEQCNAMDDDCDGKVDEESDELCFPDGKTGCTAEAGGFSCLGPCRAGTRACESGQLGECSGFRAAAANEVCSATGGQPADENCNGQIDEGCACVTGETRSCYGGPDGTAGVGKCVAGTQTCTNGMLGTCANAITPTAESCANAGADDDCDGMVDDVPRLGADCTVDNTAGPCRSGKLQCAPGSAELRCVGAAGGQEQCNGIDDDCNGTVDDVAGLMDDPRNCGSCGTTCGDNESCCGGKCVTTNNDPQHCGSCGTACTGTVPGCCSSRCVDLLSDGNCGQCGRDCSLLTSGGLTCACTQTDSGIACTGPVLNVCL